MSAGSSRREFFTLPTGQLDNIILMEFLEGTRRVMHGGALELGISASELEAKLRRVSGGILVAGLSARYRAHQVAKPLQQASESLVVASRYIITAANRFEAAYAPELEAAGHKPAPNAFKFKGN